MNEKELPKIRKIDLGDRKSIKMNFRFSKEALKHSVGYLSDMGCP